MVKNNKNALRESIVTHPPEFQQLILIVFDEAEQEDWDQVGAGQTGRCPLWAKAQIFTLTLCSVQWFSIIYIY